MSDRCKKRDRSTKFANAENVVVRHLRENLAAAGALQLSCRSDRQSQCNRRNFITEAPIGKGLRSRPREEPPIGIPNEPLIFVVRNQTRKNLVLKSPFARGDLHANGVQAAPNLGGAELIRRSDRDAPEQAVILDVSAARNPGREEQRIGISAVGCSITKDQTPQALDR